MVTKSADTANLWIVDNQLRRAAETNGVKILGSPKAWTDLPWTRKYFKKQPKMGYFVWVKAQPSCPFFSCVNIKKEKTQQDLRNLVVIEKGLKVKIGGVCSALSLKLQGQHLAQGKIVIKQGSQVEYEHIHRWGQKDVVISDYKFYLEPDSQLNYTYKSKKSPQKIKLSNKFYLQERAKVKLNIIGDCQNTQFESLDEIYLQGKDSSGISNLRFISRANSQIKATSRMIAEAAGTGHLDCQSLNLDSTARVSLIPEVTVENDQAQITHEASIGRVSEEQLNYLRMRGLTEDEAIDLIASGFLKI
ncbi:MAG: SufD family Fe-S cluster assembly protein [Patescibacteria group bacterium]|nr:SufD family Fe-S cluster assembly protein [Patescibacteria group bacterium]